MGPLFREISLSLGELTRDNNNRLNIYARSGCRLGVVASSLVDDLSSPAPLYRGYLGSRNRCSPCPTMQISKN